MFSHGCAGGDGDGDSHGAISAIGYKPFYVSPMRYVRNLEAIAELWIHCAIPPMPAQYLGRHWTFSIAGNPKQYSSLYKEALSCVR